MESWEARDVSSQTEAGGFECFKMVWVNDSEPGQWWGGLELELNFNDPHSVCLCRGAVSWEG